MTDSDFVYGFIAAIPLIVLMALIKPRILLILGAIVAWAVWVNAVFYIGRRLYKATRRHKVSNYKRGMTMDDGLISKQQAQMAMGNLIGGPAREKAQTIVSNMAARHEAQLLAWRWLNRAMENMPPSDAEEAALWELVSRMRHERY